MINDILISVVAPVYNEEKCIREYINQTVDILQDNYLNYELVLVDDGSTDNSIVIIKEILGKVKNIRLISLSRNYGREVAISAGLDVSIGDYVVLMDSDLQDSPDLIPKLVDRAVSGYDVVYAARISRAGESFFKKISSKYFYKIASSLTGFSIPNDAGDFRVFNRKVVNSISQLKESNRYMKMLYAYVGFKVSKIPFERSERYAGTTKYSYAKLFNASLDAIISFSNRPLRILSIFSMILSFLLFVLILGIFIYKMMDTNAIVEGWSSTMVFISLMFSVLFMFLSIISEYISRILIETKNRPLYYIREEHNSSVVYGKNIVDDL
jgi:polyisoprenyl-phosphate glycosyltransferase